MNHFNELRKLYPDFIYEKYEIKELEESYLITFFFSVSGLTEFRPTLEISKKFVTNKNVNKNYVNSLVFHIGLVEAISYVKCTCSPNIIVKAGYLDSNQINFFKKLYYNGLGEFMFINNISVSMDELFNFKIEHEKEILEEISYNGIGNLIPIGGGKDSCVSLELLKDEFENNSAFILNPKPVHLECAHAASYTDDKIITVKRTLDKNMLELNKKGFLNGHTPFSSLVAFITYLMAYLSCKRYIVLSNEGSANEPTILGTNINHQYSKTYEFENDFNLYTKKYFNIEIKYFSLLRALSEFQIGMLFSKFTHYHKVFKSCNQGSKGDTWNWCCNCPKCLFVYIILSPFLYKEKLVDIFGEDLFGKEELLETFKELLGYSETKPFECVGTIEEARYAISLLLQKEKDNLPYLLKYYKDNYQMHFNHEIKNGYNTENNIDPHFENILKEALKKC